jgi:hypothetical protein
VTVTRRCTYSRAYSLPDTLRVKARWRSGERMAKVWKRSGEATVAIP